MHSEDTSTFEGLGIAPGVFAILADLGFIHPTPIQKQAIPVALEGKDLIGVAETGTGKTLAFGLPLVQRIVSGGGNCLIVLPTRELAIQVEQELKKLGGKLGVKTAILIGGAPMRPQVASLSRRPGVVIGTPGRIIDHLEHRTLSLKSVAALVLDEADRMLDMGFAPQLKRILQEVPKERQTMLFSATMPEEIIKIATTHMKLPIRVEVARPGKPAENVAQEVIFVQKESKIRLLEKLLAECRGPVLVFTRMKYGAKRVASHVRGMGETAAELHSNRTLSQRREALDGFKNGTYRVLVATDIAARGIDVKGIELVVNFDLPTSPEDYVHRIGRTARAGKSGKAISFATPGEQRDVRDIERLIRGVIPTRALPKDLPPARVSTEPERDFEPRRGGPARGGHRSPGTYKTNKSYTTYRTNTTAHPAHPTHTARPARLPSYFPAPTLSSSSPTGPKRGTGTMADIGSKEYHEKFMKNPHPVRRSPHSGGRPSSFPRRGR